MFINFCDEIVKDFKKEFGERKYNQIYDKVITSSSYKKNMPILVAQNRRCPNASQLLVIIQNIPFFTFSSKRNTAIGGTILLYQWNLIRNVNNASCTDEELIEVLDEFYKRSSGLLY